MSHHDETARVASVFAENVRRELRSLTPETVADLTDGLEADIIASLADGGDLPAVHDYALDLMRAAGIDVPEPLDHGVVARVRDFFPETVVRIRRLASGLEPAWWVFRAWVLMQVVGFAVSDTDSTYWFLGQWGGEGGANGYVGVFLFALLFVASVRIGRKEWKVPGFGEKIASAIIALFAVVLLFSESSVEEQSGWFEYQSTGAPECGQPVPDFVGRTVFDARKQSMEFGSRLEIIDLSSNYDVTTSAGITQSTIVDQDPESGEYWCDDSIRLFVELGTERPYVPGTTTLPPDDDSSASTSTTPRQSTTTSPKSTSTTKPKATTTTAP